MTTKTDQEPFAAGGGSAILVLQFWEPDQSERLGWQDFTTGSACETWREPNIEHWKKTAPKVGRPWRVVERREIVAAESPNE